MRVQETHSRSSLAALREQIPLRALTPSETRHVLERQATRLLRLTNTLGPPVPIEAITAALPRVIVKSIANLPTSGRAQWNGAAWVLFVDEDEAPVRRRYSLAHELAHVVWHPAAARSLPATPRTTAEDRAERAADVFAACVLMPRAWMKRAYFDEGIQDVPSLARLFGVSWLAMQVRLVELGFISAPVTVTTEEAA